MWKQLKHTLSHIRHARGAAPRSGHRVSPRSRIGVEGLETRWCPATTVGLVNGNTVTIRGDDTANQVAIIQDDTTNTVTVLADNQTHTFTSNKVLQFDVDLKGGDDLFWYGLTENSNFVHRKAATVMLGEGHDEAWLEFRGGMGIGGQARLFSKLGVTVYGGNGDDTLVGNFNGKDGGVLKVVGLMGNGNDGAFVNLWADVINKATITFDLKGQAGDDTLSSWNTFDNRVYDYAEIQIQKDSAFTLRMDGGANADQLNAAFGGYLDGSLTLDVRGGLGDDQVQAEVFLEYGSWLGTLDAKVQGDEGNDRMSFVLTDLSGQWIVLPGTPPYRIGAVTIVNALMHGNDGFDLNEGASDLVTVLSCEGPIIL